MKNILSLQFLLIIIILTHSSCENIDPTSQEIETSNSEKANITIDLEPKPIVDSIDQADQDSTQLIQKTPEPKDTFVEKKINKQDENAINIEDALDVNKYKSVRDHPDYIGTPCEIVNGECIRHDHKDQDQPDDFD